MKTKLFSRFRNLFRRAEDTYEDSYEEGYDDYSDVISEDPAAGGEVYSQDQGGGSTLGDSLNMPAGAPVPDRGSQSEGVHVPLAPIVAGLPLELQSRLLHDVGDLSVFLLLEQILPQLSQGMVSLPFGELRRAAPKIFSSNRDQDEVSVNVPLSAILPHISPNMLARKHGPLQMEIPDDIVSPFADKGRGLSVSSVKAVQPSAPTPVAAPRPRMDQAPGASPSQPISRPTPRPAPQPLSRPIVRPTPQPAAETQPAAARAIPQPSPAVTPPNRPATRPALSNQPISGAGLPAQGGASRSQPPSSVAAQAPDKGTSMIAKPVAQPEAPVEPSLESPSIPVVSQDSRPPLQVALSAVADGWSDALKQEIIQLNLAQARLALPYTIVESGLKRGRLSFTWKTIKSWLTPAANQAVSVHDPVELELALRVIAPLFIAQQKEKAQASTKVAVDKDIPNLFSGLPRPDTSGVAVDHSVSRPLDTNYYVWDDRDDMVADDPGASVASRAVTAGTEFVTRYATPNEVVSRAAALDGVEGSVIALPDGLMVASKLPPGLNGDTLAAFLPQLFGKVTQCTQELRMGEVNNLNFTVGNVPWKIFRVNALYFAAFGVKGEPLPTARLAALAGELDHKAKA